MCKYIKVYAKCLNFTKTFYVKFFTYFDLWTNFQFVRHTLTYCNLCCYVINYFVLHIFVIYQKKNNSGHDDRYQSWDRWQECRPLRGWQCTAAPDQNCVIMIVPNFTTKERERESVCDWMVERQSNSNYVDLPATTYHHHVSPPDWSEWYYIVFLTW